MPELQIMGEETGWSPRFLSEPSQTMSFRFSVSAREGERKTPAVASAVRACAEVLVQDTHTHTQGFFFKLVNDTES